MNGTDMIIFGAAVGIWLTGLILGFADTARRLRGLHGGRYALARQIFLLPLLFTFTAVTFDVPYLLQGSFILGMVVIMTWIALRIWHGVSRTRPPT